jgi:hypothetical protein
MSRISEEVRAHGTEIGVDKKLTLDMVEIQTYMSTRLVSPVVYYETIKRELEMNPIS